VNEKGLDFYDRLVDELLDSGIQPWLTLFHWDYPYELFCKGGWLNRDTIDWFAEYTRVMVERLSDRVTNWITFNEPNVFLTLGHFDGCHAPGMKYADAEMLQLCHHAFCAHGKSVQVLRAEARQPARVGIALSPLVKMPPDDSEEGIALAREATFAVTNRSHINCSFFMDPFLLGRYPDDHVEQFKDVLPTIREGDMELMCQPLDFVGVNIYSGKTVEPRPGNSGDYPERPDPAGYPITMMDWTVIPESLYWGSRFLHERYELPIFVAENGMSGHDWVSIDGAVHDPCRIDFTRRYLGALARAIKEGIDIRGYFHWSLMDNFEWAAGCKQRFGLIHVDYSTLERTPKDSFEWYRDLIATNGAEIG